MQNLQWVVVLRLINQDAILTYGKRRYSFKMRLLYHYETAPGTLSHAVHYYPLMYV